MASHQDALTGALQENVLTLVCYSDENCQLVRHAVPSSLFSTFLYRDVVDRVYDYIDKFKKAPGDHLPDILEDLLESKKEGPNVEALVFSIKQLSENLNTKYVVTQLEHFTRQQSLKLGIVEAADAIQAGDLDRAENIIDKSRKARLSMFDPGSTLSDIMGKLKNPKDENQRILINIPELDRYGYGPGRGELSLFLAPPKRGKTWWLIHLAKYALMQKWRVLYITLEVSDEIIGKRTLQSLFSVTQKTIKDFPVSHFKTDSLGRLTDINIGQMERPSLAEVKDLKAVEKKLEKMRLKDNMIIKAFPTGTLTVNMLKAYLEALEASARFMPDLIVLDYADLMKVDADNYRITLGNLYKDLRGIAVERNLALATASQSNRQGATAKTIDGTHVAEDYSKIAICDSAISYNQTTDERHLKLARLYTLAGRNDADQFSVLVSQAYQVGQFALESRALDFDYWNIVNQAQDGVVEEETH
jgi:replicative DNA helicase